MAQKVHSRLVMHSEERRFDEWEKRMMFAKKYKV